MSHLSLKQFNKKKQTKYYHIKSKGLGDKTLCSNYSSSSGRLQECAFNLPSSVSALHLQNKWTWSQWFLLGKLLAFWARLFFVVQDCLTHRGHLASLALASQMLVTFPSSWGKKPYPHTYFQMERARGRRVDRWGRLCFPRRWSLLVRFLQVPIFYKLVILQLYLSDKSMTEKEYRKEGSHGWFRKHMV